MQYSHHKDISRIVASLTKHGWRFRRGRKHGVLIAPTGRRIAVPGTPSDCRALRNFERDVRHLALT